MSKRWRVVLGSALSVAGLAVVVTGIIGGPNPTVLNASGVGESGVNFAVILVWSGVVALILGALLFISASAIE